MIVVSRLKELGSVASLSSSDKAEIESMYFDVLDKKFTRTSCSDCYRDAIIEMSVYLKKHGKMKEKRVYKLKAGVLLQMEFGSSEFYTNDNLTDEVSEKYLAKYPDNANFFAEIPSDWQDRVEQRMNKGKEEVTIDETLLDIVVESLKDGVTAQSVVETMKDYELNGKKVTKKVLTAHVNKALEVLADMDEGDEKKTPEENEPTDQKEDGQSEEKDK